MAESSPERLSLAVLIDAENASPKIAGGLFDEIANEPAMQWRHILRPGQAMLFDNWRVLHGRSAYSGVRRMCGGYLNREDVESRLRQLL